MKITITKQLINTIIETDLQLLKEYDDENNHNRWLDIKYKLLDKIDSIQTAMIHGVDYTNELDHKEYKEMTSYSRKLWTKILKTEFTKHKETIESLKQSDDYESPDNTDSIAYQSQETYYNL